MTVSFQEPPIHISTEQRSKLESVKYYTTNQVIESHSLPCRKIPLVFTKSTKEYIVCI